MHLCIYIQTCVCVCVCVSAIEIDKKILDPDGEPMIYSTNIF